MITRTPESRCLNCNNKLDALGGIDTEDAPEPGNLVLCIACGAVMMIADDLTPRGMTREEMDDISNHAETMTFLARQVRKIRMIPKMN